MKEEKRKRLQQRLSASRSYQWLQQLADVMDRYYLDAALGFAIPAGIGDAVSAVISLVYVAFSAVKVRSFALTMAVLNNTLRDVLLGMIPFYVGDFIDIFHKSNQQNMALIRGFVEGDQPTIQSVNRKATWSVVLFFCFCFLIFLMVRLVIWLGQQVISLF